MMGTYAIIYYNNSPELHTYIRDGKIRDAEIGLKVKKYNFIML